MDNNIVTNSSGVYGNHTSNLTDTGDRYAAIELNQHTKLPTNVSISGNILTDNVRNSVYKDQYTLSRDS